MANGALFGFAEVAHFITLSATARLKPGLGLWWEGKGAMNLAGRVRGRDSMRI
jgi:hypothetical protein